MYFAVLLPSIFALYALYKKKLTNLAVLCAWVMGVVIAYCGGLFPFFALALTFVLTLLSDKLKKGENDEKRNAYQMISNILTSFVAIVLFYVTKQDVFYVTYYAVIGTSLADTLASSLGSLSTKKPVNPLNFKKMKKGESGAISFLGINASILGGIIVGLVYYYVSYNVKMYLFIILMAFVGTYIDSILGAFFQAKYECKVCHEQVEVDIHCKKNTKLIKGYKWMTNDTVNLLNNISVFIISYLILK